MRCDPCGQLHAAQHHEHRQRRLVFLRQGCDLAITLHPRRHQVAEIRLRLEEADRRGEVISEPAEPAIVEVDDPEAIAVDEEVGGTHIAVDEAEAVGTGAIGARSLFEPLRRPLQDGASFFRQGEALAPIAPIIVLPDDGVEIPHLADEAGRPMPIAAVQMQPRIDLAEPAVPFHQIVARIRFLSRHMLESDHIAARVAVGKRAEESSVYLRDRPWCLDHAAFPKRSNPGELGEDFGLECGSSDGGHAAPTGDHSPRPRQHTSRSRKPSAARLAPLPATPISAGWPASPSQAVEEKHPGKA